jgi:DNA invertase Pin-like site-specific DNA recombinase
MNAVAVDAVAGAHNNRSRHCKVGFSGARLRRGRQCDHGAFLRILEPAISTDGPMGKMVLTVLGMVAEMELGFIKARQRDGIERAKSKGDVYNGHKPTIDRSAVHYLFSQGIGASEIARRLKIGRASVYRVLEL